MTVMAKKRGFVTMEFAYKAKRLEFVPVNRIAESCACCVHNTKRGRGVRVEDNFGTFYYCDACITKLAKAKAS